MVSLPRCGSLWAFGPSAHRAHASLRACRGLGQTPGRSIVAEGAGRAHRSFRSPPSGRFALCATAHRADASLRCPKPCAAAQKSERCECPKGTRNAPRSNTLLSCMTHKRRGHPPPGGAAPPLFQKTLSLERPAFLASLRSLATLDGLCRRKRRRPPASSCINPRFSRPFGRSQRSTGFAAGSAVILRFFLHQPAFLAPFGRSQRSTGFAAGNAVILPRLPASSRVSCSLRSLATLTAFAAAEVFGALPQTPARA